MGAFTPRKSVITRPDVGRVAPGRRVVLIGDSDTSVNQLHHGAVVLRVVGGSAGNVLSSLTIGGVQVLSAPVTWTTNNNNTAGLLAAAITANGWIGIAVNPATTNFVLAAGPPAPLGSPPKSGPSAGYWGQGGPVVRGTATGTFTINVFEGHSDRGWWSWFQVLNGQYFDLINNAAISGYRLADNIRDLGAAFSGFDANVAVVHVGINDIAYDGRSAASAFEDWKILIERVRNYAPDIWCIGLPPGISPVFSSAVNAAQVQTFNRLISDYVRRDTRGGLEFFAIGHELLDPADAAGDLLAAFIGSDDIHVNSSAAYKMGKDLYLAAGHLLPKNRVLYQSIVDNPAISASALQRLPSGVGLFVNAPASNLAGGWVSVSTAGTTAFIAPAQRTFAADGDNYGENQGIDHINSGTGADFMSISTASFNGVLAAGDALYGQMDIDYAITSGAGLRSIILALLVSEGPITHIMHCLGNWANFFGSGTDLIALPEAFSGTLRTPIIEPLPIAPSAATLQLQMWAHNAAGRSVVTAACAGVFKVP